MQFLTSPWFWVIIGVVVFSVLGGPAGIFAGKIVASVLYAASGAVVGGFLGLLVSGMHGQIQSLRSENNWLQEQLLKTESMSKIDRLVFSHSNEPRSITLKCVNASEKVRFQRDFPMDIGDNPEAIVEQVISGVGRQEMPRDLVLNFEDGFPSGLQRGLVNAFRQFGFTVEY